MLSHSRQKRKMIFRIICMIMLMLIQFDAYIYEMTDSFRGNDLSPISAMSTETSQMTEGNEMIDEWADPYYRNANLRCRLMMEAAPVLLIIFCFIPLATAAVQMRRFIDLSSARCVLSSCLVFCVLLI